MRAEKAQMSKIPYASTIRRLMYAMVCTRPNIGYTIGVVNRYMNNLGREATVKWLLQYLRNTSSACLRFGLGNPTLEGYTDSNMSADVDTSSSTFGYVMNVGGAISWLRS